MASNIFVKEHPFFSGYSCKLECDSKFEYYSCIFQTPKQLSGQCTELLHIPLEIMKGIISHVIYLSDVVDKNKSLIKAKNLDMWKQFECFGVGLYVNDETVISGSIFVSPIEHIPMVGLHQNAKDFSDELDLKSIYFTLAATNELAMHFNETEKEFNKIAPEIKSKRKFKEGILVQKAEVEYFIHKQISEHCGRSHM